MTKAERNALVATAGLIVAAVGTFLPWARIGGRNRSGFNTADTFLSLADGLLPDVIAWVGRWWYLPALLAVVAWASTFFAGRTPLRIAGVALSAIAGLMWWTFVWAGENYRVLDTKLIGPIVATIGLLIIAGACSRPRHSMLTNTPEHNRPSASNSDTRIVPQRPSEQNPAP